eukprot:m.177388 g.177388  ORF g.177388 m.177388 type:complete len:249 (+) comp39158_c2_seq61:93-839(+)
MGSTELSGAWKCCKYTVFFFNLIFWIFGLALIIVGAIALDKFGPIFSLDSNQKWSSGPALIIAVGVIIFIIAFAGCAGAFLQSRPLLYTFSFLMGIMFIATIVGVILVVVYKGQIEDHLRSAMNKTMVEYSEENEGIIKTWDGMQHDFPKCCGTTNYTDWYVLLGQDTVPDSCCLKMEKGCGNNLLSNNTADAVIHSEGCYNKTVGAVEDHWPAAAGIAAAVAIIQLISVIISCGLARAISAGKYEVV